MSCFMPKNSAGTLNSYSHSKSLKFSLSESNIQSNFSFVDTTRKTSLSEFVIIDADAVSED